MTLSVLPLQIRFTIVECKKKSICCSILWAGAQQCIDLSAQMSKLAHYNPYIITVLCAYEIILIPKDFE